MTKYVYDSGRNNMRILIGIVAIALISAIVIESYNRTGVYSGTQEQSDLGFMDISWKHPLTNAELQHIASHYKIIIDDESGMIDAGHLSAEQISMLHQLNPDIKILKWISLLYVRDDIGNQAYETYSWAELDSSHTDWFLLDSDSNRVRKYENIHRIAMDPADNGWRLHLASKASYYITNYGYDGVFLDMVLPYIYKGPGYFDSSPLNKKTNFTYTNSEWTADMKAAIGLIKGKIGDGLVFVNGVGSGNSYYNNNKEDWLDVADGVMLEGFMRWDSDSLETYRSVERWKRDIDALAEISKNNKTVMVMTRAFDRVEDSKKKPIEIYALASYYLGTSGRGTVFSFDKYFDNKEYAPFSTEWSINIGTPLAQYYVASSVYQRDFTNGKVIVNPDASNTFRVNLDGNYLTLESQAVSSVTMAPHTGLILIKQTSPDSVPAMDDGGGGAGGAGADGSSGSGSSGGGSSGGSTDSGSGSSSGGAGGSSGSGSSTGSSSTSSPIASTSSGTGIVSGKVLNSSGQVIPNATISCCGKNITFDIRDGRFIAGQIPTGVQPVLYNAPGYLGQVQMIEIKQGKTTNCPTCLLSSSSARTTISGRILDGRRQRSIPGATARIDATVLRTDPYGNFCFTGVVPGQYQIYYDAPYYRGQSQLIPVAPNSPVVCPTVMMGR